jgi:Transposase, Mutator family
MTETTPSPLNNVITIDDERIKSHLDRVVRGSVEETLNALLEAEADRLCNAQRYERSEARRDTRAGHYERKLQTKAGEVRLKVPKLRAQTFETAIIERYRRRESSVEEALIEMYLAGVSVRRVEDITEALWGTRVSPSTVSDLNKKIYATIEAWRNRPIEGDQASQGPQVEGHPANHLGCLHWACRERRGVLSRECLAKVRRTTTPSRSSTGGGFAPTTRSSASCARSGGARVSWARFLTVNPRSTSPPQGCATSPARRGRPKDI